jgi:DNA invertase Pin-like site-specific DNA recombinase
MTTMKANDKQKYEQLKSLLSYGDITSISRKLKCCRGTVYNVLNGSSKNVEILGEIINRIKQKIYLFEKIEKLKQSS